MSNTQDPQEKGYTSLVTERRLDPGQEGPTSPSCQTRSLYKLWLFEAAALFLSYVFFAGAAAVLHHWDGRFTSEWSIHPFTLPGILTLLATLMKALMLVTIVACIGQLKWQHFSKKNPRPVIDMESIDSVGRGVTDAAGFLVKFEFMGYTVLLGALLMVASLLLNTTVVNMLGDGQLAKYSVPNSYFARLNITNRYQDVSGVSPNDFTAVASMQSAVVYGWWDGSASSSDSIHMQNYDTSYCLTGNCTWRDVTSLAVGYNCSSARLDPSSDTEYYFSTQASISNMVENPRGALPGIYNTTTNIVASSSVPENSSFSGEDVAVIAHIAAIDQDEAVECIMYWTVTRTTQTAISDYFYYNWTVWNVDEFYSTPEPSQDTSAESDIVLNPAWSQGAPGCSFLNETFGRKDPECSFAVTSEAQTGLQGFLIPFLTMSRFWDPEEEDTFVTDDAMNAFLSAGAYRQNGSISDTLDLLLGFTVMSMSTEVKRFPALVHGEWQNGELWGDLIQLELQFQARWRWAAYPVVMLLASSILFAMTIWQSRRSVIWKNRFLPVLYHGFGPDEVAISQSQDLRQLHVMEDLARRQKMMLVLGANNVGTKLDVIHS